MDNFTIDTRDIQTQTTVDYSGVAHVKSYGMTEYAKRFLTGQDMTSSSDIVRPPRPYSDVVWVYICIKKLAELADQLPVLIRSEGGDVIESGPAVDFWSNLKTHSKISLRELIRQTVGWGELTGERHWILDGNRNSVKGIRYIVGKSLLKDNTAADGELLNWELQKGNGKTETIPLDEIISDIDWNPYLANRGISPVEAAMLSISQDWQAATFNERKLANNAEVSGLLQTEDYPTEDQQDAVIRQWNDKHRGAKNAGKIAIATGGLKWQSVASTYVEMQFEQLRRLTREEIISAWQIPKVLVGLAEDANYGYADAEISIFYSTTFQTIVNDISEMFNEVTRRIQNGVVAELDITASPLYTKVYQYRVEQAQKLMEMGATYNEVIEQYQLGLPNDHEWGDHWWVTGGLKPAQDVLDGVANEPMGYQQPLPQEPKKSIEKSESNSELSSKAREKLWKNYVRSWGRLERKFKNQVRQHFMDIERDVMHAANEQLEPAKSPTATLINVELLFTNRKKWDEQLKNLAEKHYDEALLHGRRQIADELSGDPDALFGPADPYIEHVKRTKMIRIVEVNTTIQKHISEQIRTALLESANEGETVQQLTTRIHEAIKGSTRNARSRALTIARTETGQCVSTGRHREMEKTGVKTRLWISAKVNVRPTHLEAESKYGQEGKGVPMGQPYIVGGSMLMFPGDPSGPPQEIINCRCVEIADEIDSERRFDPQDLITKGFLEWES